MIPFPDWITKESIQNSISSSGVTSEASEAVRSWRVEEVVLYEPAEARIVLGSSINFAFSDSRDSSVILWEALSSSFRMTS